MMMDKAAREGCSCFFRKIHCVIIQVDIILKEAVASAKAVAAILFDNLLMFHGDGNQSTQARSAVGDLSDDDASDVVITKWR